MDMERRDFLKLTVAAGVAAAVGSDEVQAAGTAIPRRKLGKTGERLSIVGMGGIVLMGHDQASANKIVAEAVAKSVNYFDVAPSYGNGEAEEKLGPALEPHRKKAFLACKTAMRDAAGAQKELETSLKRLRTDHFDLYQMHALSTPEDVNTALGPGGAIETFQKAREAGKIRFIGFSAHTVEAALSAMDKFAFDTVLFPINWVCSIKGDFGPQVIKKAREKGMGILALKGMARTGWPEGVKHDYPYCWYQPVSDREVADLALRFTLSQPITAAVPPGDERLFKLAVEIAQGFKPITKDELKRLETMAADLDPIFRHSENA